MVAFQGGHPPFKGDSPYLRPQPSWAESSPTRSKVLPLRRGGWVPRIMQASLGQKKPNCRVRCMQPARRSLRASNCTATRATATPPRLRNQYRDLRQPYARPSSAILV
jgi:hypothetical protein